MNKEILKYVEELKDKIINSTCSVINIPSVFEKTTDSSFPFGKATADALNYVLDLGKQMGFKTKNIDNKCGYIEFGEGDKLLGIIGHLDVVPADNSWKYKPFDATIDNNNIYGRGAIDDKGPVIASLYAMKIIKDHFNINKRVRLILGLNEETNWKCIKRYKETEEIPTISFSPDANFPCIYAEKTIETIYIKQNYSKNSNLSIESISANNNAINVVPKFCEVVLKYDSSINNIETNLSNIISKYNYDINFSFIAKDLIKITSNGISSHAAHPNLGKNAISKLIIVLKDLLELYNINIEIINFFTKYINDDYTGKKLGINYKDESGIFTLNTAQFTLCNNLISIGFNLRIPVSINHVEIENSIKKHLSENLKLEIYKIQDALHLPKNSFLVQKLCNIFNEYNTSTLEPEAIGGGTYARAFNNCIAFGPQMPNSKDMCHQTDEYISIENLLFCTKVYAQAILEL